MPHIIVEYSSNIESSVDIPKLLGVLHETLAAQGVDVARIKTRAIKLNDFVVGTKGVSGAMIHATLLILEGRDLATKKKFADPLYDAMKVAASGVECALTLEVRDMVKDTYYM